MRSVYDQIYKYIEETLFPQFLRCCSRYVLPALEEIQHPKQIKSQILLVICMSFVLCFEHPKQIESQILVVICIGVVLFF